MVKRYGWVERKVRLSGYRSLGRWAVYYEGTLVILYPRFFPIFIYIKHNILNYFRRDKLYFTIRSLSTARVRIWQTSLALLLLCVSFIFYYILLIIFLYQFKFCHWYCFIICCCSSSPSAFLRGDATCPSLSPFYN